MHDEQLPEAHRLDRCWRALTGPEQAWLTTCANAWRGGASLLTPLLAPDSLDRVALEEFSRRWSAPHGDPLVADALDSAADVSAAEAVLAVARALDDPSRAAEQFRRAARHWRASRLESAGERRALRPARERTSDEELAAVLEAAGEAGEAAGFARLLALCLSGSFPADRRSVHLPVLLAADSGDGVVATLHLRRLAHGPPGLHPDPRTSCFLTADDAFALACRRAWGQCALARGTASVVWSLEAESHTFGPVSDGSLGGAFAVGLHELRESTSPLARLRRRRLDQSFAISACLANDGRHLTPVGRARDKLSAARTAGLRVVLAGRELGERSDVASQGRTADVETFAAADVPEAISVTRKRIQRRTAVGIAAASVLVVTLAAGVAVRWFQAGAENAATERLGASVALRAIQASDDDPQLAALLAVASRRISPGPRADDALFTVAGVNPLLDRVISTNAREIDATGADARHFYVALDGRRLEFRRSPDGALVRTVPVRERIGMLAATDAAPLLAAADIGGDNRVWLWNLADPSHPPSFELGWGEQGDPWAALTFDDDATRLVGVTESGEVTVWSVAARKVVQQAELTDLGADMSRPSGRPAKVVAADLFGEDLTRPRPQSLRMLVLTDAREMLEVDLARASSETLISSEDLPGDVTSLALLGGSDRVAIGTTRGVVLWDRTLRATVAFPFGGIGDHVVDVRWALGRLAIATTDGVAFPDADEAGESYAGSRPSTHSTPSGGPADDLAVSGAIVMAAGTGGTLQLIDPDRAALSLPPTDGSNGLAFDTRGRLLLTQPSLTTDYVSRLYTMRPGAGPLPDGASTPAYRTVVEFEPPEDWWSDLASFGVEDLLLTNELAIAGGKDPDGHGVVMVWDAESGRGKARLALPGGERDIVKRVALLRTRQLLLALADNGRLAAWSTRDWTLQGNVDLGPVGTFDVDERSGRVLVVRTDPPRQATSDVVTGPAGILAVDSATMRVVRRVPSAQAYGLRISPDGEQFATISPGRLDVWSLSTMRRLGAGIELDGTPVSLAWKPDGTRIAVVLDDVGTAVYDVKRRDLAFPLLRDRDGYQAVNAAWRHDGELLAVTSVDRNVDDVTNGSTSFWMLSPRRWESEMCRIAGRDITEAEWDRYVDAEREREQPCGEMR